MSTRRALLTNLFRLLEERNVVWCVLRNYTNLFDDSESDVDLLTNPADVAIVINCCIEAGSLSGHSLIQHTRFVNYSLVFWNHEERFTRIDIDTEKRWRHFHLLTAAQVLNSRTRINIPERGFIFIPDVNHEAVVILTQALWQGKLSDRYAQRLLEIRSQSSKYQLCQVFEQAFGIHDNLLARLNDPNLLDQLQQAVQRDHICRLHKFGHSITYFLKDLLRFLSRRRALPGLQLKLVGMPEGTGRQLTERLAILFPLKKTLIVDRTISSRSCKQTMFKGGMVLETFPSTAKAASSLRHGWLQPNRSFAVVNDANNAHAIHVVTGFMSPVRNADEISQFICTTLARLHTGTPIQRHGTFAVLLGLDGSGKTTLARNLTVLATKRSITDGIRYFHWLPPIARQFDFPLPEPGNQPRKSDQPHTLISSLLSAMRLAKNLVRANLAWWFHLRPLCKRGKLIIVDRYFYNYHLDPASVRYSGSRWLLALAERLFPKPDVIIRLNAPLDILLGRKQELSEVQISEQAGLLSTLNFGSAHVIDVDASEPTDVVARKTMDKLEHFLSKGS